MSFITDTEGNVMEIVSAAQPINVVFDSEDFVLPPSKCYICSTLVPAEDSCMGYIHALEKGGLDVPSNMKSLCHSCNEEMGDQNLYAYALCVTTRKRGNALLDASDYFRINPYHYLDKRTRN